MPARRSLAAIGATVALAAGSLALAPAAQADSGTGHSSAVVLRAGLDVSLLNNNVDVPLNAYVNDVQAPADAKQTLLSATLKGVDDGKPFNILNAKVATAKATADAHGAAGYANLVNAHVHLPGLPLLALIEVKEATSKASCDAGRTPKASSNILGDIKVLGQTIALKAGGTTDINVPAVGKVHLGLSETSTTSASAAATALHLKVEVNPGQLNVAKVTGDVALVQATCHTPGSGGSDTGGSSTGGSSNGGSSTGGSSNGGSSAGGSSTGGSSTGGSTSGSTSGATSGSTSGATSGSTSGSTAGSTGSTSGVGTQSGGGHHLAETGASSTTPYLAGAAGVLVVGGGAVVYLTRRRKSSAQG